MKDVVIKGDVLIKALYIIPYIILISIIVFQYLYPQCSACDNNIEIEDAGSSQTVELNEGSSKEDTVDSETTIEEIEKEPEPAPVEEPEEKTPVATEPEKKACTPADSGDYEIKIEKITTYKKTDTFAKVTKVKFTIQNPKKDVLTPTIKFQIQNDDSEREIIAPDLKQGCKMTVESVLPNMGIGYTDIDDEKVLVGSLYDSSTFLDSHSAKFTTTS